MRRLFRLLLAAIALGWAPAASAEVVAHFHSFNGSVFFGRYPHTFVVFEGTLDKTGETVDENFGFSARRASPAVLRGPVEHMVLVEEPKQIRKTNRHFSITLTDEQYHKIKAMIADWESRPGKFYDLDTRNCIHFVGEIGKLAGLNIAFPEGMLRRPKKWLNHITALNPQLGARPID